jgi:hypothetical protein
MSGWLEIFIGDDGTTVTGTVTEARAGYSCGGTAAPPYEQTWELTGQKTDEAFDLDISGTQVILPIVGNQATATLDNPGAGGYGATVTYTVSCVSCAD